MGIERPGLTLQDNRELYRMIISQLFYDGYQNEAIALSRVVDDAACPPSTRLAQLVSEGLRIEKENKGVAAVSELLSNSSPTAGVNPLSLGCIDLDFETESTTNAPPPAEYETLYVTSHKAPCRIGVFSPDGSLVATGSVDTSIKILDVDRMIAKSSTSSMGDMEAEGGPGGHPVIRTLYDHVDEVTCLDFHPRQQVLFSGSEDCTVKVYDFSKPSVKRAVKTITETYPVRCISLHPSGDYVLVGTMHPTLRLYDVHTAQCFVGCNPSDQHNDSLTAVVYNHDGSLYATCSEDGDIKIWDGVSNKVVNHFLRAHDGISVCSLVFSKNGKYLLSSGQESGVKLWELAMSRCLIAYTGAGQANHKQQFHSRACFSHTEDYVLFPDERTTSLCSWNSRNAERKNLLSLGHNQCVRYLSHSPTTASFVTCSDDFRARFWHRKGSSTNMGID